MSLLENSSKFLGYRRFESVLLRQDALSRHISPPGDHGCEAQDFRRVEAAYVASGHSVWGMLNAPATGEAIAELVLEGGTSTVDISAFDPSRAGLRT